MKCLACENVSETERESAPIEITILSGGDGSHAVTTKIEVA